MENSKLEKEFDAVQMVREIREAYYLKCTDEKNFDESILDKIREKWNKNKKL